MDSSRAQAPRYRPDVDGLRAVAVGLVIAFHFGAGTPGGYVGVDVFFVISGYLITELILRGKREGSFTYLGFMQRRVRRIMPAAAVMAAVVLAMACISFLPPDLVAFARSLQWVELFGANFHFWLTSGYFDGESEFKPLLHTWSLAVEEQFYLVYPAAIAIAARLGRRALRIALALALVASLVTSEWQARQDPDAGFYLLPSRSWELLLGACVAVAPSEWLPAGWTRQLLSIIGLLAIVAAAFCFSSETRFPGLAALLPCVGAAVLIMACTPEPGSPPTVIARLLSCRPMVFVGLISYSLYLWHWPVLAVARYLKVSPLAAGESLACVVVVLVLSVLSWRFVEVPLRRPRASRTADLWVTAAVLFSIPLLVGAASVIVSGKGFPGRFSPEIHEILRTKQRRTHATDVGLEEVRSGELPRFGTVEGTKACLIWGDSHAMCAVSGLDAACRDLGYRGWQATYSSTPPLLDFRSRSRLGAAAAEYGPAIIEFIRSRKVEVVVLTARWRGYAHSAEFAGRLGQTIRAIRDAGARVVIMLDVADQGFNVPLAVARSRGCRLFDLPTAVSLENHRALEANCESLIRSAAGKDATIIDPAPAFVDSDGGWEYERDGKLLYFDSQHLTPEGSELLAPLFRDALRPQS